MAFMSGDMNIWNHSTAEVLGKLVDNLEKHYPRQLVVLGFCDLMSCFLIVFGNSLVILAVWRDPLKTLRTSPCSFLILSLAIADLLNGINQILGASYWYYKIKGNKKLAASLLAIHIPPVIALLLVTVGHVMLLTVDRFYAIVTPLHYRHKITKTRVTVAACLIWTLGLLSTVVLCIFQQQFIIIWSINIFLIWFTSEATSVLHIIILYYLHKYSKAVVISGNLQRNLSIAYQRERKVFRLTLLVAFAFNVCFLPWLVLHSLIYFCLPCYKSSELLTSTFFSNLLPFVNSALNPFFYSWKFAKFRATFKYFIKSTFNLMKLGKQKVSDVSETDVNDTKL